MLLPLLLFLIVMWLVVWCINVHCLALNRSKNDRLLFSRTDQMKLCECRTTSRFLIAMMYDAFVDFHCGVCMTLHRENTPCLHSTLIIVKSGTICDVSSISQHFLSHSSNYFSCEPARQSSLPSSLKCRLSHCMCRIVPVDAIVEIVFWEFVLFGVSSCL